MDGKCDFLLFLKSYYYFFFLKSIIENVSNNHWGFGGCPSYMMNTAWIWIMHINFFII